MSGNYRTFWESEVEHFRNHPEEIPRYLDVVFEETEKSGRWEVFLDALRLVAEAKSGLSDLAKRLEQDHDQLKAALSRGESHRIEALMPILHELGFRLSVQPLEKSAVAQ